MDKIPPPCVGNCCLDQQDMCLGCFRYLSEILAWREMTSKEQQACLANMQVRKQANSQRYAFLRDRD